MVAAGDPGQAGRMRTRTGPPDGREAVVPPPRTAPASVWVLVVNRDRRVRAGLTSLLATAGGGWQVHTSAGAADAAAVLDDVDPDLAVVDVAHERAASLDLIADLSRRGVPVVALCGTVAHGQAATAHGAVATVTVESGPDALLAAVRDTAGRTTPAAAARTHGRTT